jgi:manganese efflux pump family protein
MGTIELIIIAVGLAMDAFAVSLGIGTTGQAHQPRSIFRLSFHMGFFQGLMTFLGWLAGTTISSLIAGVDHWIAFGLLAVVGIHMIREAFQNEKETRPQDPSRGGFLMMICIATSIDAMAVGLSMAFLKVDILAACLIIAIVTLALSLVGLLGGHALGERFGKNMEVLGGLLLIGIGIRIVLAHVFNI